MVQPTYEVWVSEAQEDPLWDAFLANVPGGHHVQTSLWARVKAVLGWRAVRVIATADEQIVGGAQLLWRSASLFGAVGYVPKGPLLSVDDAVLRSHLLESILHQARRRNIRYLTIQPANGAEVFFDELDRRGFRPSSVPVAPVATCVIDLGPDLETISAGLSRKTRYNVGLSRRKGMTVREGNADDLTVYHDMLAATAQRQGFSAYPKEYFAQMRRILEPPGYFKIFIAEFEGEAVAAQLMVPFGDTAINKLSVWSGRHGSKRPNELLQWHAIEWSKANGYLYYDLEGIDEKAVAPAQMNRPIPEALQQTVTSFKLGFGGKALNLPPARYFVPNRFLRWSYESIFPRVSNSALVKAAVGRYRSGLGGSGHGRG